MRISINTSVTYHQYWIYIWKYGKLWALYYINQLQYKSGLICLIGIRCKNIHFNFSLELIPRYIIVSIVNIYYIYIHKYIFKYYVYSKLRAVYILRPACDTEFPWFYESEMCLVSIQCIRYINSIMLFWDLYCKYDDWPVI